MLTVSVWFFNAGVLWRYCNPLNREFCLSRVRFESPIHMIDDYPSHDKIIERVLGGMRHLGGSEVRRLARMRSEIWAELRRRGLEV